MVTDSERQEIVDNEHLKVLSICHWVSGGFGAIYSVLMVAYFAFVGAVIKGVAAQEAPGELPANFDSVFMGIGVAVVMLLAVSAALMILSGFWIRRRRNRIGSMVLATLSCMSSPTGTFLGISTLVILSRSSVKALYSSAHVSSVDLEPIAAPEPVVD